MLKTLLKKRRERIEAVEVVLARHGINCRREPKHMAHDMATEIIDVLFSNEGEPNVR